MHCHIFLMSIRPKNRYNKDVEKYSDKLQFIPDHFKTHEMCKKALDGYPLTFFCKVYYRHIIRLWCIRRE